MKSMVELKWMMVVAASLAAFVNGSEAQVRTVTLGITTHCPYGVGGCFAEIKNGLELPDAIAAFADRPDTQAQTVDLHMRETWVPDPELFARNFKVMNVGVDVRGVEAVVDGAVEKDGKDLVLRVKGSGVVLTLARLTRTVHWDMGRNRPAELTRAERKAFEKLAAQLKKESTRVRVTGPLIKDTSSKKPTRQILEVRKFEVLKDPA